MSQENVEVVREAYAAFNRGDVDAAFKDFAPAFECDLSRAVGINVDRDVYDRAQFRRLLDEFIGYWEAYRLGADEFIDAGEHVVTPLTNRASGRDGIELIARGIWVWTIRDGAVVRASSIRSSKRPSKPPGLRSRRCRRRTWRACAASMPSGSAGTCERVPNCSTRRSLVVGASALGLSEALDRR